VQGSTAAFLTVRSWPLEQGEAFGREEDASAAKVCILGKTVVDKLFVPGAPVLGEQIRVKHVPCKVIGILSGKGQNSFGQDQDDLILVPWSTAVRRLAGTQSDAVGQLMIAARSPGQVDDAEREVTALLKQRHHLGDQADPDFQIRNLAEMQDAMKQSTQTIATLLASVALISLLVGGIGIANVTTSVSWNHVLDKNWSVHTVLGITQLASDAADSPLTKRKTTPLLMTGIAYKF